MFSSIDIQYNYTSILNNAAMMPEMVLIRQQRTYIWKMIVNQLQTKLSFILHKYKHCRNLKIVFQTWIVGLGDDAHSECCFLCIYSQFVN